MADHAEEDDFDGDNIFIYRGGRAPQHVTHAIIDESVNEIEEDAFFKCKHLVQVETHDGILRIGKRAFSHCDSLPRIHLKSVVEIDEWAFCLCRGIESVEFGNRLETIGKYAFHGCSSLTHLKLPSIITIGKSVFNHCNRLTDIELSKRLERIGAGAFFYCSRLQRIAIPLKRDLFSFDDYSQRFTQFHACRELVAVDLVGGVHKTVSSLHMESWRTEMIAEINRINQVLSCTAGKTDKIRQWIEEVIQRIDQYKAEHYRHVKEGITLLELALWKANIEEKETDRLEREGGRTTRGSRKRARKEISVTSGADVVIKNVLPFLQLLE